MIVSFSLSNFRSFAEEETFSLVASNRFSDSHQNHSIPIPDSDERVLRTAVLYGANGAGKSNLFKALSYVRTRAIRVRKKSTGTGRTAFRFDDIVDKASTFDLRFIAGNKLYSFGIKLDDHKILEEWLIRIEGGREKTLYERITSEEGNVSIEAKGLQGIGEKLDALFTVGGPQNQTFLATIRATLDPIEYGTELNAVLKWFEDGLNLVTPAANFKGLTTLLVEDPGFLDFASAFLRDTSTGIQRLGVNKKELTEEEVRSLTQESVADRILRETETEGTEVVRLSSEREILIERGSENHYYLLTVGTQHEHKPGTNVSMELSDESDGTRRLLNLIPALHQLRKSGGVYFIDEIDRSMHPLLVWTFLDFFLKSCEGGYRQIIVTTHESNLLDLDLLRRDEIWFAEKDQTGATKIYSLSDFKIRKDLEVRKHYLQGRFGAIPFLGNLNRLLPDECKNA